MDAVFIHIVVPLCLKEYSSRIITSFRFKVFSIDSLVCLVHPVLYNGTNQDEEKH